MASEERLPSGAPPPNPTPPKVFSLSLGASKPKQPPLSHKPLASSSVLKDGTKRRHVSTLSDSEGEEVIGTANQPQLVSAFDHSAGGAIGVDDIGEDKGPLVIPSQKNRDWREESKRKRGKNLLPPEVQAGAKGTRVVGDTEGEAVNGGVQAYGLTFVERATNEKDGDVEMVIEQTVVAEQQVAPSRAKTDDELALEALTSNEGTGRNSNLVLPLLAAQQDSLDYNHRVRGSHVSEDDAYRLDVASRPDPASLDDYAAVPVEEFGAALLRGMGWKEGDIVGKRKDQVSKPRVIERRPALLGIGAKEVPGGVGEELGAWGKGAKKGGRVIDKTYNPVVLKNSKTGEMLTEEELKAKKEEYERAQKGMEEDWRERRDRNLGRDLEWREGKSGSRGSSRYGYTLRMGIPTPPNGTANPSFPTRNYQDGDRERHNHRHHHHHHHHQDRDHRDRQDSSGSRDHSSRRERSRSSDSRHRRRRDGDGDYGSDRKDRERDSRDQRRRDGGSGDEGSGRRRRDRDKDRGESSGDSSRPRERGRYEEEKSRRRQEVF
ncbi:MAG: hypothetical protein M1839_000422 [Geoglossum umbratile]|nr:MAG: hypothetical protein M1839_000422 [Geoglossum umbratile]